MNIFSGARRIAAIIGAVWAVGVLGFHFSKDESLSVYYRVPTLASLWLVSDKCNIGTDALEYHSFETLSGKKVDARFCFAANRAIDGRMLVPYAEKDKYLMLNSPHSPEVDAYTEAFVRDVFKPTESDYAALEEKYSNQLWYERGRTLGVLFGGLAFFWFGVWGLGWVVRGFLSIPRGQDYRVVQVTPQK